MFREDDGEVLIGPPGAPEDRPPGEPLYGCVLAPRAAIRTLSICADSFMQLRELRRTGFYRVVRGSFLMIFNVL